jgi:hypothetical protein
MGTAYFLAHGDIAKANAFPEQKQAVPGHQQTKRPRGRKMEAEENTMPPKTRVKERAEEQASAMNTDQQAAIRIVANDLHRLNQSVMKAVEAGVSVELVRSARHHGGNGNWGDLLIPVIVTQQPVSG